MGCRKEQLINKYGEAFVEIITGGWIVCPVCKCTHAPGINYYFEGEPSNEQVAET